MRCAKKPSSARQHVEREFPEKTDISQLETTNNMAGILECINYVPTMARVAFAGGDINAVWDEAWHRDLVLQFLRVARERCEVDAQQLALMHSDDLTKLFETLAVPVAHRVVIRRYAQLPAVSVVMGWALAKACFVAVVTSWRFLTWIGGRALLGMCVGAGATVVLTARRTRRGMLSQIATFVEGTRGGGAAGTRTAAAAAAGGFQSSTGNNNNNHNNSRATAPHDTSAHSAPSSFTHTSEGPRTTRGVGEL